MDEPSRTPPAVMVDGDGSMSRLAGVEAKLERTDKHTAELRKALAPIVEQASAGVRRRRGADPFEAVFEAAYVPELPASLGAIVGDALFNLRSALDHFAWQLVDFDGGVPSERTQFPIYDSPLNDKGQPRLVTIKPGIKREDLLKALADVQPYNGWDDFLWILRELRNTDNHRLLLTMVATVDFAASRPYWGGGDPSNVVGWQFMVGQPIKSGDVVARIRLREPDQNFDPHVSLLVALDEGPEGHWIRQEPVADLLGGLRRHVTTMINWNFGPILNEGVPWSSI